jgi:enamine deaminase RidA (YjgF/YER057c/UK114 family)
MSIKRINPDSLHKNPAFTQVVTVKNPGQLVYVGGQNAVNVRGEIVGNDIGTQSEQAYRNLLAALEAAGATLADVFKMTIYFVQGNSIQDAYAAALRVNAEMGLDKLPPPIVTGIVVAGLANPQYLIEIEAVAALS